MTLIVEMRFRGGEYGEGYEDLLLRSSIGGKVKRFAVCGLYAVAVTVVFVHNLTPFACI